MTFAKGRSEIKFIEHTPKKWAEFVKMRNPIAESIVPLHSRGRRNWFSMKKNDVVRYAQWFVDENGIESKTGLRGADYGIYKVLLNRKLIDRVKFKADERAWRYYSDDELVVIAQKFIDENGIDCRKGLRRMDGGFCEVLRRRRLMDGLEFKADERKWGKYSDEGLVAYAQSFVDAKGIESKNGLRSTDGGLHATLIRRMLLDNVKFKGDERAWRFYPDDELVDYAQKFVDDNRIKSRSGLLGADGGLYQALRRRRLLDKLNFKADERKWGKYSDEGLVAYAQSFVDAKGIESKNGLKINLSGLYNALVKRKLLGQVFCEVEREKNCKGLQEISDAISEFSDEE